MPDVQELYQTVIITSVREELPGIKTFFITYEDGSAISYAAGQFITLVFNHHGKEERRSFSISASPALDEQASFTVKRIDNGAYSRLLADRTHTGDKLITTGAAGLFTLPADMAHIKQVFFFAAGIGITPVISLIKTLLHTNHDILVTLVYSSRSQQDTVFYNELQQLVAAFPQRFTIQYLYSTSFNLSRARLSKALLPVLLSEMGRVPHNDMLFYVCGPSDYMRMVILSLEEQRIRGAQVRKENFNTNDRRVRLAEPPDKDTHNVTIHFKGHTTTFPVIYPDTILQAAKKQGLTLPYSCETGRCGSCSAICTNGIIWLSYNEVLMDTELKHGAILTCTGHPIGGDAEISV